MICFCLNYWLDTSTPKLSAISASSEIVGGCPSTTSAYLHPDPLVEISSITFCGAGDAFKGQTRLKLPAGALEDSELVVAGYVDGSKVTLRLIKDGETSAKTVIQYPAETWQPIDLHVPRKWRSSPLLVVLDDHGTGFTQWAGIGLRAKHPVSPAHIRILLILGILATLLPFASLLKEGGGSHGDAMTVSRPMTSRRNLAKCATLSLATLVVLMFRRPDQFTSPYIWVEDGTVSLPQYLTDGWLSLVEPVAGYLILPSKIIHLVSMSISATHYPAIANWLNVVFHAATLCILALSPTRLRFPLLCALTALLVPTDAEVFGTSHYAFWWGSLLLVPPLLWRQDAESRLWPRIAMSLIGGLSSPLVIVLAPLYVLRSFVERNRNNHIVLATALLTAAVQFALIRASGTHGTSLPQTIDVSLLVQKFLGMFVYNLPGSSDVLHLPIGIGLAGVMLAAAIQARKQLTLVHLMLLAMLGASIVVSLMRAPLDVIDPIKAGPRYFFYPYIFLGWLILQLVPVTTRPIAALLSMFIAMASLQTLWFGWRTHVHIDWQAEISACANASSSYAMPIHYDGTEALWHTNLAPEACRALLRQDVHLLGLSLPLQSQTHGY